MKKLFIEPDPQKDERYMYVIYETFIQDFCEANFGRQLTDIELNRVAFFLIENASLSDHLYYLYDEAVTSALEDTDWSEIDEDFLTS